MNLLETLTGEPIGINKIPSDEYLERGRDVLGSRDLSTALILSTIAISSHLTSMLLPDIRQNQLEIKRKKQELDATLLVSDQQGVATRKPAEKELTYWPVSTQAIIRHAPGAAAVSISALGDEYTSSCHYMDGRLYITWPKELGLRGALAVDNENEEIIISIPLLYTYPSGLVSEQIKSSAPCFELLEKEELSGDFFVSDTPQEAIGVFILAMYNHAQKLTI